MGIGKFLTKSVANTKHEDIFYIQQGKKESTIYCPIKRKKKTEKRENRSTNNKFNVTMGFIHK